MNAGINPNYILEIYAKLSSIDGIAKILDHIHNILKNPIKNPELKEIVIKYDYSFKKEEFIHGLVQFLPLIYKCNYYVSCINNKNEYLDGILDYLTIVSGKFDKTLNNRSVVKTVKTSLDMWQRLNSQSFQIGIIENSELINCENYNCFTRCFTPKNIINPEYCIDNLKNNTLAIYLIDTNKPILYPEILESNPNRKIFNFTYEEKAINSLKQSILEVEDEYIFDEIHNILLSESMATEIIYGTDPVIDIEPT